MNAKTCCHKTSMSSTYKVIFFPLDWSRAKRWKRNNAWMSRPPETLVMSGRVLPICIQCLNLISENSPIVSSKFWKSIYHYFYSGNQIPTILIEMGYPDDSVEVPILPREISTGFLECSHFQAFCLHTSSNNFAFLS